MTRSEIIQALDEEIMKLCSARELIQGSRRLDPAIAKLVSTGKISAENVGRRNMSEEGRRRIAEAQRLRWAKYKTGK